MLRRGTQALWSAGPALLIGLLAVLGMASPPFRPVELVLLLAQTVPLLFRARWPAAVLVITAGAAVVQVLVGLPLSNAVLGQAVATAAVVSRTRWPLSLVPPVAVLVAITVASAVSDREMWGEIMFVVLTLGLAWVFGDAVARRRALREVVDRELAERSERNGLRTRVAAVGERLRISGELHQLVGGGLDAIVVQAGAARLAPGPLVVEQITAIETVGRGILAELDRFLVLLRQGAPAVGESMDPPDLWERAGSRGVRRPGRSPHLALVMDGILAVVVVAITLPRALDEEAGHGPSTWWAIALFAVMTLPLVWRRRRPELVATVVLAAAATQLLVGLPINDGMVAVAVALHAVAARSRRRAVVAGVLGVGVLVAIVAWSEPGAAALLGVGLGLFVAVALYIGETDRAAAAHATMLSRRLAEAEESGRLRLRAAVVDQRAEAARDLHDSVGHTVSLIVLLSGAARLSAGTAVESLTAIERSARSALAELDGRIAGVEQAEPSDPAVPTAEDLRRLGDDVRSAGTEVTIDVDDVDHLPPGVARAVFRIVQEALTNVMKHAAGGAATVHVEWVGRRVRVRVADTGGTGDRRSLPSGSRGLAFMRERVALFGGQLSAGPDAGSGFVVDARIPVAAPLPSSVEQVVP